MTSEEIAHFMASNKHIVLSCPHCNSQWNMGDKHRLFRSKDPEKMNFALSCSKCDKDIPFYLGLVFFDSGHSAATIEYRKRIMNMFGLEDFDDNGKC